MVKRYLVTQPGERIDQPDFQYAIEESRRSELDGTTDAILVGTDAPKRSYIIDGFACSFGSGMNLIVNGGKAILGYSEHGVTQYGAVITAGDASQTIDLTPYGTGSPTTYKVWIRAQFREADFGNRLAWNSASPSPTEYPRVSPTRHTEAWEVVIEQYSPGAEWTAIYSVDVGTSSATNLVDLREFFFDDPTASGWGDGPNDRNASRSSYGVKSLFRALLAIRRQLKDIIGGSGWWSAIPASLTTLSSLKLNRDGSNTVTGDITPDSDNARQLGTDATRFAALRAALVKGDAILSVGGNVNVQGSTASLNLRTDDPSLNTHSFVTAYAGGLYLISGGPSGLLPLYLVGTPIDLQDHQARFSSTTASSTGANPPPNTTNLANVQTAKNMVKAWASARTNGSSTLTIMEGHNVDHVSLSGGSNQYVSLNFPSGGQMDGTSYFYMGSVGNAAVFLQPNVATTTYCRLRAIDTAGSDFDLTTLGSGINIMIFVLGTQTT